MTGYAIPFHHRKQTLHWHAEIALSTQRFYLLLDQPSDSVLQWQPYLRYLRKRAQRAKVTPTLALLCPARVHAKSVLRLAATVGLDTLGAFAALSPGAVLRQFGAKARGVHDLARGIDLRLINAATPSLSRRAACNSPQSSSCSPSLSAAFTKRVPIVVANLTSASDAESGS